MRLNFSHATEDEVELRLKNLKLSPTAAPNHLGGGCAVLLDTQGPEIRTGGLRVVREQNNRRAKVTIEKGVGVGGKQRPAWPASGSSADDEAPGSLRPALALAGSLWRAGWLEG
jgi:pyruvate kinase